MFRTHSRKWLKAEALRFASPTHRECRFCTAMVCVILKALAYLVDAPEDFLRELLVLYFGEPGAVDVPETCLCDISQTSLG